VGEERPDRRSLAAVHRVREDAHLRRGPGDLLEDAARAVRRPVVAHEDLALEPQCGEVAGEDTSKELTYGGLLLERRDDDRDAHRAFWRRDGNGKGALLLLALAAIHLYAFPYFANLRSANELPRIITVQQLVEHGTFRLDGRMGDLGSVADVSTTPDGRHYQNKAPGLSLLGAAAYAPLSVACRLAGDAPSMAVSTWVLRTFVVTLPWLGFLAVFRRVARRFAQADVARDAGLLALALGSMAFPYALLFMSHAPAAALVGTAFATATAIARRETSKEGRAAAGVGLLLGLAMLVEYQAVFAALLIGAYAVAGAKRRARVATIAAAAATPCLAILAAYHAAAFGSPFVTGYAYSVDEANRVGVLGVVGVSPLSLAQLAVRPNNGLLVLSPWMLLSAVGAVAVARDPGARRRVGAEALVAVLVTAAYVGFVASLEPSFGRGGWSIGPRYLAIAVPFLGWLAVAGLDVCARRTALFAPACALIGMGVLVHVAAATTFPHWPSELTNPLFEVSLRLLSEGYAPPSLGGALGLRGWASLAPLYAGVVALLVGVLGRARARRLAVALGLVVAVLAVGRYQRFGATKEPVRSQFWGYVVAAHAR